MASGKIRLDTYFQDISPKQNAVQRNLFTLSYILHRWLGRAETLRMLCRKGHRVFFPELCDITVSRTLRDNESVLCGMLEK